MRLRAAIKIVRNLEEPWRYKGFSIRYRQKTADEAWKICEKKWRDDRVPYLPNREEAMEMREEIFGQLLLGGPMFEKGILEGLVPEDVLEEARREWERGANHG